MDYLCAPGICGSASPTLICFKSHSPHFSVYVTIAQRGEITGTCWGKSAPVPVLCQKLYIVLWYRQLTCGHSRNYNHHGIRARHREVERQCMPCLRSACRRTRKQAASQRATHAHQKALKEGRQTQALGGVELQETLPPREHCKHAQAQHRRRTSNSQQIFQHTSLNQYQASHVIKRARFCCCSQETSYLSLCRFRSSQTLSPNCL